MPDLPAERRVEDPRQDEDGHRGRGKDGERHQDEERGETSAWGRLTSLGSAEFVSVQ